MWEYVKKSIKKFTEDSLSKLIYDSLIWLIPTTILFAIGGLLPKETTFAELLSIRFDFTLYLAILVILTTIILTILAVYAIFRAKYLKLQTDYFTDELTGLKNHKALEKYLESKLVELRSNSKMVSLILIDIDDFKKMNDNVGYNTADQILKKIAELLGNDKRITDETFRYFARGDEFLVIADDTSLTSAFIAAERKRELIANTSFVVNDKSFKITVSCGVTECKRGSDNFKAITDRVTDALRQAKSHQGKNCTKSVV